MIFTKNENQDCWMIGRWETEEVARTEHKKAIENYRAEQKESHT
jgi:hypothetical protein